MTKWEIYLKSLIRPQDSIPTQTWREGSGSSSQQPHTVQGLQVSL